MMPHGPGPVATPPRRCGAILFAAAFFLMGSLGPLPWSRDWLPGSALADDGEGGGGGDDGGDDGGDRGDRDGDDRGGHGDDDADNGGPEDSDDAQEGAPGSRADRSTAGDFVLDELVVLDLGQDAAAALRRFGFTIIEDRVLASLGLRVTRLRVPRSSTAEAARALVAARFPDLAIERNSLYRLQATLDLPAPDYPRRLIGWGEPPAGCGAGLRLGLLDTGVDRGNAALVGARILQRSFLRSGAKPASTDHGTAVAAILVGRGPAVDSGLLPGAELAVAAVFTVGAADAPATDLVSLIRALDWLAGAGARVINMSLAGDPNALLSLAVRRVLARGVALVAAVGNGGAAAPPAFPAAEPGVIAATAVDSGARLYAEAGRGDHVDFAAPGVRIWTPGQGASGRYRTGTSFAAPFVTAAAAAAILAGAPADPERLAAALARTAVDLGAPGRDPLFGWGLIQGAHPCGGRTPGPS